MKINSNYARQKAFIFKTFNQVEKYVNKSLQLFDQPKFKTKIIIKDRDERPNGSLSLRIFTPYGYRIKLELQNEKITLDDYRAAKIYLFSSVQRCITYLPPNDLSVKEYDYFIMLYHILDIMRNRAICPHLVMTETDINDACQALKAWLITSRGLNKVRQSPKLMKEIQKYDNTSKYLLILIKDKNNKHISLVYHKNALARFYRLVQLNTGDLLETANIKTVPTYMLNNINYQLTLTESPEDSRKKQAARKKRKHERAEYYSRNVFAFLRNEGRA